MGLRCVCGNQAWQNANVVKDWKTETDYLTRSTLWKRSADFFDPGPKARMELASTTVLYAVSAGSKGAVILAQQNVQVQHLRFGLPLVCVLFSLPHYFLPVDVKPS